MALGKDRDSKEAVYDLRIVERMLRKGAIDPEKYKSFLKGLPDDEQNSTPIDFFSEEGTDESTPFAGGTHGRKGLTFITA